MHFSNHSGKLLNHTSWRTLWRFRHSTTFTGYGRFGGSRTTAEELAKLFGLMEQNGLLLCERLLTGKKSVLYINISTQPTSGYVPGAQALVSVKDLATKMKQMNPELIYLLDRESEAYPSALQSL